MSMSGRNLVATLFLSTAFAGAAAAADPKFEFQKPPEKPPEWQVQAKGGLLITTGNSQSRNANLGLTASHQVGGNRLSLDGNLAYGRSNVLRPIIDKTTVPEGVVTGLERAPETTTNLWKARGRYDRFITEHNSAYVLGQLGADRVAGKKLIAGGQTGYSRQLLRTDAHTTVAELGYDFSFESYVDSADRHVDPTTIHSARVFVGELWKLTADTGINGSVEALFNLNKEKAPNASDSTGATNEVKAFKDTRVTGKLGLTTTLWKSLSFGFGFTVLYDQNPAPRPLPASAKGAKYAPTFHPFADRVDTLTEATLVFTFL
jgi:putative salt-induced outer membrane protein YdiY